MTLDEQWDCDSEGKLIEEIRKATRLETAEHILAMWNEPWPVTRKTFIDNLVTYIEELKK